MFLVCMMFHCENGIEGQAMQHSRTYSDWKLFTESGISQGYLTYMYIKAYKSSE